MNKDKESGSQIERKLSRRLKFVFLKRSLSIVLIAAMLYLGVAQHKLSASPRPDSKPRTEAVETTTRKPDLVSIVEQAPSHLKCSFYQAKPGSELTPGFGDALFTVPGRQPGSQRARLAPVIESRKQQGSQTGRTLG